MSGVLTDVHADSVRVGVRLGISYLTGALPAETTVEALLATLPPAHNINVHHVALAALVRPAGSVPRAPAGGPDQDDLRRAYVMKAFEGLIHHAGDTSLLTKDTVDHLVELAWHAGRKNMEMEQVVAQLGTLAPKAAPA